MKPIPSIVMAVSFLVAGAVAQQEPAKPDASETPAQSRATERRLYAEPQTFPLWKDGAPGVSRPTILLVMTYDRAYLARVDEAHRREGIREHAAR